MRSFSKTELYDWACAILFLSIPLSILLPNLILSVLVVLFILRRKEVNFKMYKKTVFIIPVLMLLFFVINSVFSGNLTNDLSVLTRLGIFIVLLLLLLPVEDKNRFRIFFIIGVNISILISGLLIVKHFFHYGDLPFGNTKYVNEILLLERPYFGFVCTLSAIMSYDLFRARKTEKHKYLFLMSFFVAICFVFLISARMSILTLFLIGVVGIIKIQRKKGYRNILMLLIILILTTVFFIANENIRKRFYFEDSIETALKKIVEYEPRITIWPCCYNLTKSSNYNLMVGFGSFHLVNNSLIECYSTSIEKTSKRQYYLDQRFNSHNQFVDILLSHGIIGLAILVSFFILIIPLGYSDYYSLALIMAFFCFFLVENALHRQLGCYLFGALFVFINNGAFKKS